MCLDKLALAIVALDVKGLAAGLGELRIFFEELATLIGGCEQKRLVFGSDVISHDVSHAVSRHHC